MPTHLTTRKIRIGGRTFTFPETVEGQRLVMAQDVTLNDGSGDTVIPLGDATLLKSLFLHANYVVSDSTIFTGMSASTYAQSILSGTQADDNAVGTVTWSDPDRVASSDNSYATATVSNSTTHYLKATNFGFSIPSGATISGIVVEIEKKSSGLATYDSTVKLVVGGTVVGDNKGVTSATAIAWPTGDAYTTYGAPGDLWGLTPATITRAAVNLSTFGVVISAFAGSSRNLSIDHIRITVYYRTEVGTAITLPRGQEYTWTAARAASGYCDTPIPVTAGAIKVAGGDGTIINVQALMDIVGAT